MPDNSVNFILTSPPYNIGIDYETYKDNLPWIDYLSWCESWLEHIYRILAPSGRFCLNVLAQAKIKGEMLSPLVEFYRLCERVGFRYRATAIWYDVTKSRLEAWGSWKSATSPYIYCPVEVVLILYKGEWKRNPGKSTISNTDFIMGCSGIWHISPARNDKVPSVFPIGLAKLCLNLLTFEGDIVLDPFMGSGTTAMAAELLNRKWIGIELNPAYCAVAQTRLDPVWRQGRFSGT